MIPQFTPTNVFSARWQSRAKSGRDSSKPTNVCQVTAIDTSTAAEEESPAAMGTSLEIATSTPGKSNPRS